MMRGASMGNTNRRFLMFVILLIFSCSEAREFFVGMMEIYSRASFKTTRKYGAPSSGKVVTYMSANLRTH
jgi:hypothetical protein